MRIHLAQRAGPFVASTTPWLAEFTSHVLLENKGASQWDTVIQITGQGYFWRSDLCHLANADRDVPQAEGTGAAR